MFLGSIAFLAATTAVGAIQPDSKSGTPTECGLSLQVVKDLASQDYGKPIVFDVSDPTFVHVDAEKLAKGWTKSEAGRAIEVPAPPMDVAAQFAGAIRDSVSRCRSVRVWLTKKRIRYGEAAVNAVVACANDDDELPAGIFTVSLPAIGSDGRTALIYTSDTWGGEAGGGFARLYRRQSDGSWKFEAEKRLWTS